MVDLSSCNKAQQQTKAIGFLSQKEIVCIILILHNTCMHILRFYSLGHQQSVNEALHHPLFV